MPPQPPRMLIFAAAFTSGLLLAIAASLLAAGFNLRPNLWAARVHPHDLEAALAWWLVALCGLLGSFAAGCAVQRPGRLRFALGIALVLLVASAPFVPAASAAPSLVEAFATHAAVVALGLASAFCGSWFALPR